MTLVNPFGILVEARGEGWARGARLDRVPVIGTSGDRRRKALNRTPNSTLMRQVYANLG
jgi:hypothetical protein